MVTRPSLITETRDAVRRAIGVIGVGIGELPLLIDVAQCQYRGFLKKPAPPLGKTRSAPFSMGHDDGQVGAFHILPAGWTEIPPP